MSTCMRNDTFAGNLIFKKSYRITGYLQGPCGILTTIFIVVCLNSLLRRTWGCQSRNSKLCLHHVAFLNPKYGKIFFFKPVINKILVNKRCSILESKK